MERTEKTGRAALDRAVDMLVLDSGSKIVLGVSGGPDSVAMLRAFARLAPQRRWHLCIGHVNHGLRGEQSDEDERFVRQLASALDLPVKVAAVQTGALARADRLSLETAARNARYEALWALMEAWSGDALAVAHTMDDQAETLLLHLLRGAGTAGLGGMQSTRGKLVRPLLGVRRETVLSALQEDRQGYRIDESNLDEHHARGRMRRTVIPALKQIQTDPVPVLARSAWLLQEDADLLARGARELLETLRVRQTAVGVSLPRAPFAALHPSLRRSVLRLAVEHVRGSLLDVSAHHIESIDAFICGSAPGGSVPLGLPGGIILDTQPTHVILHSSERGPRRVPGDQTVILPGTTELSAGTIHAEIVAPADAQELRQWITVCGPYHALCDADHLGVLLTAGSRRPGDRIRPLGLGGTKTIQDLFVDRHIPADLRDAELILRNDRHVVWVPGVALDERVAVTGSTNRVFHLVFRPNSSVFPC